MVTYTDTYVEMLQEDLQHQYRRLFEVGNDLVQALRASEGKDLEISTMKNFLDSSELTLSDALRTVSVRDIEIERLTFALKDKDEELAKERRKRSELQCDVIFKNQELMSFEDRIAELVHTLSNRDIEIERLTFALKDKENERDSLLDTQEQEIDDLTQKLREKTEQLEHANLELEAKGEQVDVLMAGIKRLARKKEKDTKQQDRLQKCEDSGNNLLCQVNALWERLAEFGVESALQKPTIDELWTLVKIHKEDIAGIGKELAVQGEMLATLDRHDALISKAFGCIDNHSDSIYKQQQSIDNLWLYVQGIAAHINTGSSQENP